MKRTIVLLALVALCIPVLAQTVDTTGLTDTKVLDEATTESLLKAYNILYGALVIIWGYVGKLLKLNAKVPHYVFVVLAGGLVIAGAFVIFGFGKAIPLLFTFLSAIGIYDLILKPAGNAIKPKE